MLEVWPQCTLIAWIHSDCVLAEAQHASAVRRKLVMQISHTAQISHAMAWVGLTVRTTPQR